MAIAFAKSLDTLNPPVITKLISEFIESKYFLALESAYIVGTEVDSLNKNGLEPVAPPLPSIVIKSGSAKTQCSRSSSILPAAIFIPIGLPPDFSLSISTISFKSSLLLISGNLLGL